MDTLTQITLWLTLTLPFNKAQWLDTLTSINAKYQCYYYSTREKPDLNNAFDYIPNISLNYYPVLQTYGMNINLNMGTIIRRAKRNKRDKLKKIQGKKRTDLIILEKNIQIHETLKVLERALKLRKIKNAIYDRKEKLLIEKSQNKYAELDEIEQTKIELIQLEFDRSNENEKIIKVIEQLRQIIPILNINVIQ